MTPQHCPVFYQNHRGDSGCLLHLFQLGVVLLLLFLVQMQLLQLLVLLATDGDHLGVVVVFKHVFLSSFWSGSPVMEMCLLFLLKTLPPFVVHKSLLGSGPIWLIVAGSQFPSLCCMRTDCCRCRGCNSVTLCLLL